MKYSIKCESGREFIVYAATCAKAVDRFSAIMPTEKVVGACAADDADALLDTIDNRKAPGA